MSTDTQDSREVVEIVARAMCAADGFEWEKQFSHMTSANGDDSPESYLHSARAALTAIEASGWKIVPVEPTEEMLEAGGSSIIRPSIYMGGTPPGAKRRARDVWADMLSASPKVTR